MKWFSLVFVILLLVGMLLGSSSVAYADDPPDGVTIDIEFTDGEVEIFIDGVKLGGETRGGGVSLESLSNHMGVTKLKRDVAEIENYLNLTATGLAKVITVVTGHHESTLADHKADIYNISVQVSNNISRLASVENKTQQLSSDLSTLQEQVDRQYSETQHQIDVLEYNYNRKLMTMVILFSVVIIGLAIGLGLLWRKTKIT